MHLLVHRQRTCAFTSEPTISRTIFSCFGPFKKTKRQKTGGVPSVGRGHPPCSIKRGIGRDQIERGNKNFCNALRTSTTDLTPAGGAKDFKTGKEVPHLQVASGDPSLEYRVKICP